MRSSLFSRQALAVGVVCVSVVSGQGAAIADETITKANNGSPANSSAKTVNGGEKLTVETGAQLLVPGSDNAVTGGKTVGTIIINNSGTISQIGSGRAIRNQTDGSTLEINNAVGASIT